MEENYQVALGSGTLTLIGLRVAHQFSNPSEHPHGVRRHQHVFNRYRAFSAQSTLLCSHCPPSESSSWLVVASETSEKRGCQGDAQTEGPQAGGLRHLRTDCHLVSYSLWHRVPQLLVCQVRALCTCGTWRRGPCEKPRPPPRIAEGAGQEKPRRRLRARGTNRTPAAWTAGVPPHHRNLLVQSAVARIFQWRKAAPWVPTFWGGFSPQKLLKTPSNIFQTQAPLILRSNPSTPVSPRCSFRCTWLGWA